MKLLTVAAIAASSTLLFAACTGNTAEQPAPADTMESEQYAEGEAMERIVTTDDAIESDAMAAETAMGGYVDYSETVVNEILAAGKTPVLFFHATWCPTCKAADADIMANEADIPENVVIIKTDYDSNGDLKKKYAVTTQHTFVQLDENMDEVTKWNGGSMEEIIENIQ